jgi:hypothetical protein
MPEHTEFKSARRQAAQALLESMLTKAGFERDQFEALHRESEAERHARIAQSLAEADAQSAAMEGTVRRDVENWRYAVEHLKTLAPPAAPVQRILLETAADISATPGLTLDATQVAPLNNTANLFLFSENEARVEAVSFGFIWQNASDKYAVVNVDGYLVLNGNFQAIAYGGAHLPLDFRNSRVMVDASLNIQELWNQPPTSPVRQASQDWRVLSIEADASGWFDDTHIVTQSLYRGVVLQYTQLVLPPQGTARIEVSCVLTSISREGQGRFIFRDFGRQVLGYGVLIGVLP